MDDLTQEEIQEIERIIRGYLEKEYGPQAEQLLQSLATLLQDPGVKLVHFGNTVFLIIFTEPQVAEIHTMSLDESPITLAKNFVLLNDFLKNIDVKEWYSYTDDPRFMVIAKKTRLPLEITTQTAQDGKEYTIYRMRLQ